MAPGSFQSELGCPGDWQPDCLRSWLQDPDGDGIYTFRTSALPAGSYEVKVAINESWDENYGAGGVPNGANIAFTRRGGLRRDGLHLRRRRRHVLTVAAGDAPPQPSSVTIPGSFQSELGCSGDWQPDCAATHLAFDADGRRLAGHVQRPGRQLGVQGGAQRQLGRELRRQRARSTAPNIGLTLAAAAAVKFYYDHATHWVTSNRNASDRRRRPAASRSELGCPGDWQPDCLRSWLQDPDGDGIYTLLRRARSRPATTRPRWRSTRAGTRTTAPAASRTAPTSRSPCPRPAPRCSSPTTPSTHVLDDRRERRAARATSAARRPTGCRGTRSPGSPEPSPPTGRSRSTTTPDGALALEPDGVSGGDGDPAHLRPGRSVGRGPARSFPHLAGYSAFKLPGGPPGRGAGGAARPARRVGEGRGDGTLARRHLAADPGRPRRPLRASERRRSAPSFASGVPTLRLWAPTARRRQAPSLRRLEPRDRGERARR